MLNQATYSTIASSSCERVRQTRSRISSVLKLSTKLSASALMLLCQVGFVLAVRSARMRR